MRRMHWIAMKTLPLAAFIVVAAAFPAFPAAARPLLLANY